MEGGIDIGLDRRSLIGGLAALSAAPLFAEDSPPGAAPAKRRVSAVTACPVPAVEMRVPTMGGNLYARGNGPLADGPAPVLFLHGGPGGSHLGMVGALPLADTRGVILYDQLDCGLSDRPGDRSGWNVDRFVSEIDSMRRAFNLDRFHLSGTSWGGTLALEYAARRPEGLESLILLSPLVSTRTWLADAEVWIAGMPADKQAAIAEARRTGNYEADSFMAADLYYARQHLSRERLSPLHLACQGRNDPLFNLDLYMHMWGPSEFVVTGTLGDYDGEHLLPQVAVPTLFIGGEFDEARPSTLKDYARRVPDGRYRMIAGSGHWVENDRPAEHQQALRDWLKGRA
ncbi:MAG: peptidase S33 [Sphingomonas sp.]|nr:MAG: peptidase S33 [Sphingomonas sp.]